MSLLDLMILFALTVVGSVMSLYLEAAEIHKRNSIADYRELPHWILVLIRLGVAMIFLCMVPPWPPRPLNFLMALTFMASVFGPIHRLGLNLTRINKYPQESRTITWYHLRKKSYDRLLFFIKSEKTRFVVLCAAETIIAGVMGRTLTHQ